MPDDLDFIVDSITQTYGNCDCREDIPTERITFGWDEEFTHYRAAGQQCEHCGGIRGEVEQVDSTTFEDLR